METSSWVEYKIQVKERLRQFAISILNFSKVLPNNTSGKIVNNQITKAGTSVYANYRAALRGRSKAGFYSKISIVVEEADETEMWFDLIIASGMVKIDLVKPMHNESLEILKILASMRKRASD